jgi:hypothetical protein
MIETHNPISDGLHHKVWLDNKLGATFLSGMVKIDQKVQSNPSLFGQLWPLFKHFKGV